VWIGGHSWAGVEHDGRPSGSVHGLLPIASGSVALSCYPPRLQRGIRTLGLVSRISGAMVGHFPGQRIGFGGREARGVMKDWVHVAHTGRYEPVGTAFNYARALARLAMPVLALNFQGDSWAPEAAASYLLGKLPQCQREKWTWGDADTGGQHLDHFSWTKHPQLLAPACGWADHSSSLFTPTKEPAMKTRSPNSSASSTPSSRAACTLSASPNSPLPCRTRAAWV
jgi:hypothetical protein